MRNSDYMQGGWGEKRLHNDSGNALKYSVQNVAEFPSLGVFKLQLGKTLSNLT